MSDYQQETDDYASQADADMDAANTLLVDAEPQLAQDWPGEFEPVVLGKRARGRDMDSKYDAYSDKRQRVIPGYDRVTGSGGRGNTEARPPHVCPCRSVESPIDLTQDSDGEGGGGDGGGEEGRVAAAESSSASSSSSSSSAVEVDKEEPAKTGDNKHSRFCITYNVPTKDAADVKGKDSGTSWWAATLDAFKLKKAVYLVGQFELAPTTKKLHWQGYVEFKDRIRLSAAIKRIHGPKGVLEGAHIEVAKGTAEENKTYCTKDESRVMGPWEWGKPKRVTGVEKSKGWEKARKIVAENPDITKVDILKNDEIPAHIAMQHADLLVENARIVRTLSHRDPFPFTLPDGKTVVSAPVKDSEGDFDKRSNWWVVAPSNFGKSNWLNKTFAASRVYVVKRNNHPFDNYDGQQLIIFDDWYPSFGDLVEISDVYDFDVDVVGGTRYRNKTWPRGQKRVIVVLKYSYPSAELQENPAFINRFHVLVAKEATKAVEYAAGKFSIVPDPKAPSVWSELHMLAK